METKKNNNKDVTKVICQNCGAEVIIPQHESTVIGTAIGQDSGLGTVVLPTKGGCGCAGAANPMDLLQALSGGNANVLQTIVSLSARLRRVVIWTQTASCVVGFLRSAWRWCTTTVVFMKF